MHRLLLPVALVFVAGAVQAGPQRYASDESPAPTPASSETAPREPETAGDTGSRRGPRNDRPAPARSSTQVRPNAPRWHSFLPGMFR